MTSQALFGWDEMYMEFWDHLLFYGRSVVILFLYRSVVSVFSDDDGEERYSSIYLLGFDKLIRHLIILVWIHIWGSVIGHQEQQRLVI